VNVLQLTSDWKWTGPAAPMLELLLAQRARGERVELACPEPPPGAGGGLAERARAAGVEPRLALSRGRGARLWRDRDDARRLRALLAEGDFDVLHAWHTRDHVLALRARGRGRARIVRSLPRAERLPRWPWNRWLLGPGSDGLIFVSPGAAARNRGLRPRGPLLGCFGAVDLERFSPRPAPPSLRAALGIAPGEGVVAIAARVQARRRFDLLLEATARLVRERPRTRLLVIGRGSRRREIAEQPARRLGLADRVIFAGHRDADYPDVLRLADVFTLLVPGSDGGCRALLEASACGIPAVATRRGALPEIVVDGETGLVVDERPEALSRAWLRLLDDAPARRAMGLAARRRAEREFSRERLGAAVDGLYREVLAARRP
jgi:glycosyltransferase involved in cell wall biosynthesis